ncbi:N-acetylmuramoyl-L-alanine amidase [Halovivax sp.]|uniref:N-acetylmuramoyl-L-alanine amidase n=1 Tax=Halovivax sp. TaxID=1935978 RepID=UPI0025BA34F5|nr:N-acetylmuramoyl-L-alanine amidase [Halovivax sp.]
MLDIDAKEAAAFLATASKNGSPVIAETTDQQEATAIARRLADASIAVDIEECSPISEDTDRTEDRGRVQEIREEIKIGGPSPIGRSRVTTDIDGSRDVDSRRNRAYVLSDDGADLVSVDRLGKSRIRTVDATGTATGGIPLTVRVYTKGGKRPREIPVTSGKSGYATVDLTRFRTDQVERIAVEPVIGRGTVADEIELPLEVEAGPILVPIPEALGNGSDELGRFTGLTDEPDATDAENAPELFNPTIIREDGNCKLDFEATVETRHNRFHQIVRRESPRLSDSISSSSSRQKIGGSLPTGVPQSEMGIIRVDIDGDSSEKLVDPGDVIHAEQPVLGKLNAYEQTWNRVGHGIGKLLYSLALAPQEETKVAVIEWSREDRARRDEQTRADESVEHELHRDRMIEDVVEGVVEEMQQGGSSTVQGGVGIQTSFMSLGGGAAHSQSWSEGHRQMTLDTVQALSDSVVQGSSAMRSLRSSVVTQSQQIEDETIRTRIVQNHNEHHALTIQYFQVLEHYKIRTELAEQRDVLLIPYEVPTALWEDVPDFEEVLEVQEETVVVSSGMWPWSEEVQETTTSVDVALESDLVDWVDDHFEQLRRVVPTTYDEGFEAIHRFLHTPEIYEQDEPVITASRWTVKLRSGWRPGVSLILHKTDGTSVRLRHVSSRDGSAVTQFRSEPVEIKSIESVEVVFAPDEATRTVREELIDTSTGWGSAADAATDFFFGDDDPLVNEYEEARTFDLDHLRVTAHTDPTDYLPQTKSYEILDTEDDVELSADNPATDFKGVDLPTSVDILQTETKRYRDYTEMRELLEHIKAHPMRYLHDIWLTEEASARALRFDRYEYDFGEEEETEPVPLLELIENRPVGITGNLVAFPLLEDGQLKTGTRVTPDEAITERLVSLPTGGVFAEAMLSRCMASEPRDITRNVNVSDGDQSSAPSISGVTPGSRGMDISPSPSQLPAPLAGLQSAPAAPNPQGMDAGAQILGSSSLFRDMSLGDATVGAARTLAQQALQESGQNYRQAMEAVASLLTGMPLDTDTSSEAVDPGVNGSSSDVPKQAAGLAAGEGVRSASPDNTHDQLRNIEYAQNRGLLDDTGARTATGNVLGDTGWGDLLNGAADGAADSGDDGDNDEDMLPFEIDEEFGTVSEIANQFDDVGLDDIVEWNDRFESVGDLDDVDVGERILIPADEVGDEQSEHVADVFDPDAHDVDRVDASLATRREDWYSAPPRFENFSGDSYGDRSHDPSGIAVHHTGQYGSASGKEGTVQSIHADHFSNGWSDIGYHLIIDKSGAVYEGMPLGARGNHTSGHNSDNVGIALIGDFDDDEPGDSSEQFDALEDCLDAVGEEFDIEITRENVKGHNEFSSHETNDCPGENFIDWLDDNLDSNE